MIRTKYNGINSVLCTGLKYASREIHKEARKKGFWDSERETGTLLMLCVSELSEALEADRKSRNANLDKFYFQKDNCPKTKFEETYPFTNAFEYNVKDTFEDEIADTIIRLLDLCVARGIDIEQHINLKLEYNRSRERMHGKAY